MRKKRILAVAAFAAAALVGGAAPAVAAGAIDLATEGSSLSASDGWEFFPASGGWSGHGGLHWWGYVDDTQCDGDAVYAHAKVHGYSWAVAVWNNNDCGGSNPYANQEVYDPATNQSSYGWIKVCEDDFAWDTCSQKYVSR